MSNSRKIVSLILAAGKGSRMQSPLHKVCIPLEGRPVLVRAIETYQRCGIESHYVVVGSMADQVMEAASSAPGNLFFAYQTEQRGTGHAAKTAVKLLSAMDYQGDVLVVAGDKVIEDAILRRLMDEFHESDCDLAFIVGDVNDFPNSGRILYEDERPIGNVEVFDIQRARLLTALRTLAEKSPIPADEAAGLILSYLPNEKKAGLALGSLWDAMKAGHPVTRDSIISNFGDDDFYVHVNARKLLPESLDHVRHANLSVYLFKARALYSALDRLTSNNAQQEEYLTDTIGILAESGFSLRAVPVQYPEEVMAFNTPEELKAIEDYLIRKRTIKIAEPTRNVRPASDWLKSFESADSGSIGWLLGVYGDGSHNVETKRRMICSMLTEYIGSYGDGQVVITRAPGRVNIMGRHVDHQGGHANMIVVDKDFYLVAGPRNDPHIHLRNLDSHHFPERDFSIDELVAGYHGGEWLDFINRQPAAAFRGDWSQYVRAATARFQTAFPRTPLKGMNLFAAGDVPIASGLSSSSAVVVAEAEAIVAMNGLDVSAERFVELCGEGEWYVGTRGGAGDHGAMKFGRRGQVVQLGFFPFEVTDAVDFPTDYSFVVCNSHEKAWKMSGARDVFNHRVACYGIGCEILKQEFPQFADRIRHLRDFNKSVLGVSDPELLQMLKILPISMGREEVIVRLGEDQAAKYLSTHAPTFGSYPIRPVVLYGLAECERSMACPILLKRGAITELGRWMNASHDGDRVVQHDPRWKPTQFAADCSDGVLESAALDLVTQIGGYSCSTARIDRMVDIALGVNGVLGAQILGAGLGGCMLVLLQKDSYELLEKAMIREYYEPANLEPDMFACCPIAGSGVAGF
jgi:N-acetylgalactosamine kinase